MVGWKRLRAEQEFHDAQARRRAEAGVCRPQALLVDEEKYLDHESWIRPALGMLGEVRGKRILDFGSGHGLAGMVLARRGARVTALELSRGYLHEAQTRAKANGIAMEFLQADGHRLPFADHSFDGIWGNAILHHLNIRQAALEIRRVLVPGGSAVFCEPWGQNALLNWARQHLRYREKERTIHEQPLLPHHLDLLRRVFPHLEVQGFQLFSMVRRIVDHPRLIGWTGRWDNFLLRRIPRLQAYCRYMVLKLPKSSNRAKYGFS
jgi:2-polyprenyl-3-methyl-5-hydroxy-6-metoxy-1,4-benzoquinol methylase